MKSFETFSCFQGFEAEVKTEGTASKYVSQPFFFYYYFQIKV
jgi:hypothetical protein